MWEGRGGGERGEGKQCICSLSCCVPFLRYLGERYKIERIYLIGSCSTCAFAIMCVSSVSCSFYSQRCGAWCSEGTSTRRRARWRWTPCTQTFTGMFFLCGRCWCSTPSTTRVYWRGRHGSTENLWLHLFRQAMKYIPNHSKAGIRDRFEILTCLGILHR